MICTYKSALIFCKVFPFLTHMFSTYLLMGSWPLDLFDDHGSDPGRPLGARDCGQHVTVVPDESCKIIICKFWFEEQTGYQGSFLHCHLPFLHDLIRNFALLIVFFKGEGIPFPNVTEIFRLNIKVYGNYLGSSHHDMISKSNTTHFNSTHFLEKIAIWTEIPQPSLQLCVMWLPQHPSCSAIENKDPGLVCES